MRRTRAAITVSLTALLALGLTGAASAAGSPLRLRADLDHDGHVDAQASPGSEAAAIFLPNLDDDSRRCEVTEADLDAVGAAVDERLAACNDAADAKVDGRRDLADLARLRLDPVAFAGGATGKLRLDAASRDKVRIFVRPAGSRAAADFRPVLPEGDGELTAAELRGGLEFGVEGRDVVRGPESWNGRALLTLSITDGDRRDVQRLRLREAPMLVHNDLQAATKVFAAKPGTGPGWPEGPPPIPDELPGDWGRFSQTLDRAGGPKPRYIAGSGDWWKDMWWQDIFEPTTVTMPSPDGAQLMRVLMRSGNSFDVVNADGEPERTPRPFARQLFKELRGPGVGVVQQLGESDSDLFTDLRNATGNVESLPPYRLGDQNYPQGRVVYGVGEERGPDESFTDLLTGMGQGVQSPVTVDTDWLMVGHVDETFHVVRADNDRGWTLMVADPRLAVKLLAGAREAGGGDARLFTDTIAPDKPTVSDVLADTELLSQNETAAEHIDDQVSALLKATGLRAGELVRAPVLFHHDDNGGGLFRAYTPGLVNGLSITANRFAAPEPHGPVVDGQDVFKQATAEALRANGVTVRWVEDFSWAHLLGGEVHCSTNAYRDVSGAKDWWR